MVQICSNSCKKKIKKRYAKLAQTTAVDLVIFFAILHTLLHYYSARSRQYVKDKYISLVFPRLT